METFIDVYKQMRDHEFAASAPGLSDDEARQHLDLALALEDEIIDWGATTPIELLIKLRMLEGYIRESLCGEPARYLPDRLALSAIADAERLFAAAH
jgi:hypothetical protein